MQQNGLFDVFLGVVLLANALSNLLDEVGVASAIRIGATLALYAGGVLGFWLARKKYVVPRVGVVKFGPRRRLRIRQARIALAVSVTLTLVLAALAMISRLPLSAGFSALGRYAPSALIGIMVLIPLIALAYALDYPRMVVHGMLFVGAEFATVALGQSTRMLVPGAIAFGVAAAASLSIGLVVFSRFLRSVPRVRGFPAEADVHDR